MSAAGSTAEKIRQRIQKLEAEVTELKDENELLKDEMKAVRRILMENKVDDGRKSLKQIAEALMEDIRTLTS
ncbi:hypothetical protein BT69DRAFT_1278151 [Atractiella rhizophila]|nr:hypothetical protein BT69DRAFT_1278151 [Atractiella rhizophila]